MGHLRGTGVSPICEVARAVGAPHLLAKRANVGEPELMCTHRNLFPRSPKEGGRGAPALVTSRVGESDLQGARAVGAPHLLAKRANVGEPEQKGSQHTQDDGMENPVMR